MKLLIEYSKPSFLFKTCKFDEIRSSAARTNALQDFYIFSKAEIFYIFQILQHKFLDGIEKNIINYYVSIDQN